jgi:hypothetical protein
MYLHLITKVEIFKAKTDRSVKEIAKSTNIIIDCNMPVSEWTDSVGRKSVSM